MKKMIMVLVLTVGSLAFAHVDDVKLKIEPGSQGACSSLSHLGNWGFAPAEVFVDQNHDTLSFTVTVLNFTCANSVGRTGEVSWDPGVPNLTSKSRRDGKDLELLGVSGFLHEADGYRIAQFTVPENLDVTNDFFFSWNKPGLTESLNKLAKGGSLNHKFIFGLKALYFDRNDLDKRYQSFSGRYGVYVTWTKQWNGQITVQQLVKKEKAL